jgi:hypothetical protein
MRCLASSRAEGQKGISSLSLVPFPHSLSFLFAPFNLFLLLLLYTMTRLFALLPLLSLAMAMPTPGASSFPPFPSLFLPLTIPSLPLAGYDDDKSSGVDVNIEKNLKVKDKEVEVALKEVRLLLSSLSQPLSSSVPPTTDLLP